MGNSLRTRAARADEDQAIGPEARKSMGVILEFALMVAIFVYSVVISEDYRVCLYSLPLFAMIMYAVYRDKNRDLGISSMYVIVYYLYFVLSPIQNISDGRSITYLMYQLSDNAIAYSIFYTTGFFFCYLIGQMVVNLWAKSRKTSVSNRAHMLKMRTPDSMTIVIAVCACAVLYVVFSGGLGMVISSRNVKDAASNADPNPIFSVASTLSLSFIVILACCSIINFKNQSKDPGRLVPIIFVLGLLAIFQNPFNTPRFFLIGSWAPVLLTLLQGRLKRQYAIMAIIIGAMFIMPILSVTSRLGSTDSGKPAATESVPRLKDMDAYDSFAASIDLFDGAPLTWGKNLQADFLFFVPRTVWPDKPYVLGLVVGRALVISGAAGTANLSYFYGGDFLFDFGILGLLAAGLLSGMLTKFLDDANILIIKNHNVAQYIFISALPIIIRGPVGAVIGLLTSQLLAITIYALIFGSGYRPFSISSWTRRRLH